MNGSLMHAILSRLRRPLDAESMIALNGCIAAMAAGGSDVWPGVTAATMQTGMAQGACDRDRFKAMPECHANKFRRIIYACNTC